MIESRLPWVSPCPQEQDRGARHEWSRPLSYDPKASSRHLAIHIIDKILTALESLAWIYVYATIAPGSGFAGGIVMISLLSHREADVVKRSYRAWRESQERDSSRYGI